MLGVRESSRAIIIKDGQILLMKRDNHGSQYYALIGGGLEPNEKPVEAVIRELREEASIEIANPRLAIVEDAGKYGIQYIFHCDYLSGEPKIDLASPEFKDNSEGKNTYQPQWISLSDINEINLLPKELKSMILKFIDEGFPDQPIDLKIEEEN